MKQNKGNRIFRNKTGLFFWKTLSFADSETNVNLLPVSKSIMYKVKTVFLSKTKGPLNLRMNGHRDDWKHSRFERSPVAEHLRSTEHDFLKHASVCCIDHSPEWTDSTRKSRESYWIRRLNTLRPHGINKND